MDEPRIDAEDGAVRIAVRVKPRASREGVVGVRDGALEIALHAPPVDGAANEALRQVMAKLAGVPKRDVTIVLGQHARQKVVRIAGLTPDALRARIATALA